MYIVVRYIHSKLDANREQNTTVHCIIPVPELEKYNDNAVSYRYFYITITNESSYNEPKSITNCNDAV